MSLYSEWEEKRNEVTRRPSENPYFWKDYYEKEKEVYQEILKNKENKITGTVEEVADKFNLKPYELLAFLDGIETSLNNKLDDLKSYELESQLELDINFEKLLYNMHLNKASWLYSLSEWDGIFSPEKQQEIEDEYHYGRTIRKGKKIGRNDPCPCGSGKKYKNCCGRINKKVS